MDEELKEREREWAERQESSRLEAAPILADLAEAGYRLRSISDLWEAPRDYRSAIPLLMSWLPRTSNYRVKEMLVRALTVPAARPAAASLLIAEFRRAPPHEVSGLKWSIGNALSVVADDSVFEQIEALVTDGRHGKAREMLALALGNMRDPRAVDVLIRLLDDQELAGHAIMALGKLKPAKARPCIERFLDHPQTWIRNAAKRAMARIEKGQMQG